MTPYVHNTDMAAHLLPQPQQQQLRPCWPSYHRFWSPGRKRSRQSGLCYVCLCVCVCVFVCLCGGKRKGGVNM